LVPLVKRFNHPEVFIPKYKLVPDIKFLLYL
jgi:hypothetical protein